MSLQKLNVVDRVPYNVLANGAIRYGVYDSEGNLLRYEYMKREDEPIAIGTDINKILFDKVDHNTDEEEGERKKVDRYNIPDVSISYTGIPNTNDIIPKAWTSIDNNSVYANGIILSVSTYATAGDCANACDGDISTKWQPQTRNNTEEWIKLQFPYTVKIKKMRTFVGATNTTNLTSWSIEGCNDDANWDTLYSSNSRQTELEEISLNNNTAYKFYRIYITRNTGTAYVNVAEWQVSEWEGECNILTLDNKINGYFENMRTLIQIRSNSEDVTHLTTDILPLMSSNTDAGFVTSASSEGNPAYQARNANNGTVSSGAWQPATDLSSSDYAYWQIRFPFLLRINTINIHISYLKGTSYLEGLKANGEWEIIASDIGNTSTGGQTKTITITSENYYIAVRISITGYYSSSYKRPYLYDFQITEGYKFNYDMRYNTYLNINNLGNKKVNNITQFDKNYELIYDGSSFNAHKSLEQLEEEIEELSQAIINLGGVL